MEVHLCWHDHKLLAAQHNKSQHKKARQQQVTCDITRHGTCPPCADLLPTLMQSAALYPLLLLLMSLLTSSASSGHACLHLMQTPPTATLACIFMPYLLPTSSTAWGVRSLGSGKSTTVLYRSTTAAFVSACELCVCMVYVLSVCQCVCVCAA